MLSPEDRRLIEKLHIRLGRTVDAPFAGEYRSAFRGQGMEFEDVRMYIPGDDVRAIDWNVTARLGRPHIKQFREERELQLMLMADVSASMRFGKKHQEKKRSMATIVGALAFAALRNGDRVGMLKFAQGVEEYIAPKKSRGHVWSLIHNIFLDPAEGKDTRFSEAIVHFTQHLRRRCTVCIVSDFLFPLDTGLQILAHRHSVHAFIIHDPGEYCFPLRGLIDMMEAESEEHRLVDSRNIISHNHVDTTQRTLQKMGIRCTSVSTDTDPVQMVLAHFRQFGS